MSDEASPRQAHVVSFVEPVANDDTAAVIAAVAALLAFAGKRVLVIDGDGDRLRMSEAFAQLPAVVITDRPEVGAYLGTLPPTREWAAMKAQVRVTRHLLPGQAGQLDLATLTIPGLTGAFADAELVVNRLQYDYVLIGGPAGVPEGDAVGMVVGLSDATVVSFRMNEESARPAARTAARLLGRVSEGHVVVPLATTSEDGAYRAAYETVVGQTFEQSAAGPVPEMVVLPVPAEPHPMFALVNDEVPGGLTDLLAAAGVCEPLAESPVPPRQRLLYRLAAAAADTGRVLIAAPGRYRAWREWIVGELESRRVRVSLLDGNPAADVRIVLVVGPDEELSAEMRGHLDAVAGGPETGRPPVLHVKVTLQQRVAAPSLDLTTQRPEVAAARLRAELIPDPHRPAAAGPWPVRYPGTPVVRQISNFVNTRNEFIGREHDLDRVRDLLLDGCVVLVNGAPGAGKRELLTEYSRRFRQDYDVCWWVAASDRSAARQQMAALRAELDQRRSNDNPRRLLIFHNADDLAVLQDLVPGDPLTHVLVTSREGAAAELNRLTGRPVENVEIQPFTAAEGADLLAQRLPSLDAAAAHGVVERLGGTPLAVHLAATTLVSWVPALRKEGLVGDQLARAAVEIYLTRLDAAEVGDDPLHRALALVLDDLAAGGVWERAAIQLARLCSFLSPDRVSLWLVRHPDFLRGLASMMPADDETPVPAPEGTLPGLEQALTAAPGIQRVEADFAVVDQVMAIGARHGLFAIDWDAGVLRMHRLMQEAVQALLSPEEAAVAQEVAIESLAACAPSEAHVENERSSDLLIELARHVQPSGALISKSRAARTWVVKQFQFTARYGDEDQRRAELTLADSVAELWTSSPGDEDVRLRLDAERAALRAGLGDHAAAVPLLEHVQTALRTTLPAGHIRNFLVARSLGRSMRGAGRFADALVQDNIAFEGFRRILGADNPNTLWAANNLAFSQFLNGNMREAVALGRMVLDRWLALQTWSGPRAWQAAINLALYLRETGRYDESGETLRSARDFIRRTTGQLPEPDRVLRIDRHQAALFRATGQHRRAEDIDLGALKRSERLLGDDHDETLLCRLACAADAHLEGRSADALAQAVPVVEQYRERMPAGHPYVALCLIDLAAIQTVADPGRAAATADEAVRMLHGALGARHPWTVAARINLLAAQEPTADPDELRGALARLAADSARTLTDLHPFAQLAAVNARRGRALESVFVDVPPM